MTRQEVQVTEFSSKFSIMGWSVTIKFDAWWLGLTFPRQC